LFSAVANRLARETGFTQRTSPLTGAHFSLGLVSGWLANPQATLEQLAQSVVAVGGQITPQGLDQRFTWPAAQLLRGLLETAVGQVVAARPAALPILQRFTGVFIQDSTTITLPQALHDLWPGSGQQPDQPAPAGLKVQVQWDYASGQLSQVVLQAGKRPDQTAPIQYNALPPGSLRLSDLGYFSVAVLAQQAAAGCYWLNRLKLDTALYGTDGVRLDLQQLLRACPGPSCEQAVRLGQEQQLPCRLLAVRVPAEVAQQRRRHLRQEAQRKGRPVSQASLALANWTILVTNVPAERLTLAEALVLLGCRWQIELLFKLWKSHGQVDVWRTQQPWRILCEVYAKLLGLVLQHWLFLVSHWSLFERSLFKAAQTVRQLAGHLAACFGSLERLSEAIELIRRCLLAGCRINKSLKTPRTYQQLAALGQALGAGPEPPQPEMPAAALAAIA
jgi:hypothetical protein